MAEKEFKSVGGFVQFEVDERPVSNQTVRDVTIRHLGAEGPLIRITVWPEHDDTEIDRGDLIFVDGPYEERVVQTDNGKTTYRNMSATNLVVLSSAPKAEKKVANKKPKASAKKTF